MLGLTDLFQSEEFLSVEFAPSSLKVALAQPDGSSLSVDYVDRESVDPDESDRVEKYTRALSTLRQRRSFTGINQVAFTLPTSGVIVRPLELPAVSDDRLERAVRYEVEDKDSEIPFSPEDVVMDYEVIERTEKETRVVLAVVKRDKLEEYLQVIRNVDLEVKIIDVNSFSLFNFYQYFQEQPDPSSPKALVDVGEFHTDIVVFRGSSLQYARSISVAGRTFTQSIRDHLDVDLDRAEELKVEQGNLPLTDEPEVPPPPEPPIEDMGDTEDGESGPPAPPPPSGEVQEAEVTDEEEDESLALGTEFGTDAGSDESPDEEASEEPSQPPEEGDLDLEGGLETETDPEDEDETETLTLGEDQISPEEREKDEESRLDSGLDLGSSESKPEPPSPPDSLESTSEDQSDEDAPPPPPSPPDSSESEIADSSDDTEENRPDDEDLTLGTENEDEDSPNEEPTDESTSPPSSPSPPPAPPEDDTTSGETKPSEQDKEESDDEPEESDRQDMDLDLGFGERRTPNQKDDSNEELTDPLSDDSEDEDNEDDEAQSLGAAANQPPAPPPEPDYDPENLQEALEQPVHRLIDELRQTFDYFRDEMKGDDVQKIVLCGNGARVRNMPAYLENEMGRDTRYFEPGGLTGLTDKESIQTMMSVLGLQLRSDPSRCSVQLNLLPQELVRKREQQDRRRKIIANGALAGLLALQVLVWLFYSYQVRLSHLEQSEQQLDQVQPIVDRVRQLESTQSTLQQRLDVINELETNRARLLPVLYELNQLEAPLSERTWIRNLSFSAGEPNGVLEIEGVTGSFQDVSRLYQWLEKRDFTEEQTSGSQNRSTITVDGQERGVVQFNVGYEVRFNSYNSSEET